MPLALTHAPRPSLVLFTSEPVRAAADLLDYLARPSPPSPRSPDRHTVVLFPGLGANGLSMWTLRQHLLRLGYRAIDWGEGFNAGPTGDIDVWLKSLKDAVLARADVGAAAALPAGDLSLVGWSLGGFYAREIAKLAPERVRRVITIGTPFNGSSAQTHAGWLFKLLNGQAPAESPQLRARLASPPPVPTTAIFSRRDGVVAWQTCQHGQQGSPSRRGVTDIEVSASHLGMGWNREVLGAVANELARPADLSS
jgi:pimeloyl-ACP methyl ester carboxylesterase